MHFGLSPETDAIISTAIYAAIIGAMLLIPYFATDYLKRTYRTKPVFRSMRESGHHWPVIVFFVIVWGLPVSVLVISKFAR